MSLIAIGIPTIILLLFEFYMISTQTQRLEADLDRFLKDEAVQLSASLSAALYNLDDQSSRMICQAALAKPPIHQIQVWDGNRLYLNFENSVYSPEQMAERNRFIEHPITFRGEKIGRLKIVVSTVPLEEKIKQLKFNGILQVVILDLTLGLVLFLVLVLRFVKPLRALEKSSKKIAQGDLNQPINIHRHDELGALADNLIMMRESVKEKVASLTDEIEQHRKTALALEKSESFMRLIIDLIPHMIFVKDKQGRFLVVNQAMAKDLGRSVEDVVGKKHLDLARDRDQIREMLKDDQRVIAQQKTISVLTESHGTDPKASQWFATKKVPFAAPDGDIGVVGITSDISDIKQVEMELTRTKGYIDNIINSMPSALFSVDRHCRIILWNRQAEQRYGILSSEAVSKPLVEVLPSMAVYQEKIDRAMVEQTPYYSSKQSRIFYTKKIYEDITIYPLAQGVDGAVIRVDDVTEQVQMEEMVIQSEKMLSIGGLAAGMAHEINNPLSGMMQNAQVVMQRLTNPIPASVKIADELGITLEQIHAFMEKRNIFRQLDQIRDAGIRASQIVQNMLSFSRKEQTGKSSQNIAQILDKTLELARSDYDLKKQYDFRKIEIVREYDPQTPQVICEASKIQQVFFNLLKNAAQAMHETKQEKAPRFILRIFPKQAKVFIEIEDNGPGIEKEIQKRIFEPFFTTKAVGKGTGLGMSVSYFIIVDNHNGDLKVVSEPGKGTTFIVELPVQ